LKRTAYRLYTFLTKPLYEIYERKLEKQLRKGPIPQHIAIIMDGNRRYARELGVPDHEGHKRGGDKLEEVMGWVLDLDIKVMTVYAMSTENFKRSGEEVAGLMKLFERNFMRLGDDARIHKNKVRIKVMGQREFLPPNVLKAVEYAEKRTEKYDRYQYNLAVAYGGREEILSGIRRLARDVKDGKLDESAIDEECFASYLYTADLPDPDLVLRTSGEERISNFLLWQVAYSELYFVDIYWPGFRRVDFYRAIRSYQQRKRRFGK